MKNVSTNKMECKITFFSRYKGQDSDMKINLINPKTSKTKRSENGADTRIEQRHRL